MNHLPTIPVDYNATLDIIAHTAMSWLLTMLFLVGGFMAIRGTLRWLMRHH